MPRIPAEHIDRIKREIPIEELVREYGIELENRGKDLFGRCPWHEDSDPSFSVTPEKNLWNCLAGCGGGDSIQLVMRCEKMSFRQAAEKLLCRLGLAPRAAITKTHTGTTHEILAVPGEDMSESLLMRIVTNFYHSTFCNQPQAMSYLQKRKCFHPEAVKAFQIGYGNRTIGYRVPTTTVAGKELKARLQRIGILRESGHEHLSGSVVIPLFNEQGDVVQMYGRKIEKVSREAPKHLYLRGELRGVFNRAALEHQKEILLCESILDALSLWSAGFRNVTTTFGTNNFTGELWQLLERLRPERIILCFDHDEAGEEAVKKYAPRLAQIGARVLRAKLPYGEDINEVARNANNPSSALAACIERASEIAPRWEDRPKHVALEVDEMTGEPLPFTTKEGLEKGIGWAPYPFIPAPYDEVIEQQEAAKKIEPASAPLPNHSGPPSSLAAAATSLAASGLESELRGEDIHLWSGEREYRVRGLAKNLSFETLKVQLRAMRKQANCQSGSDFHLDTLDMCNAKHRYHFIEQAAEATKLSKDILKRDLGLILLKLEEHQEENIRKAIEPQNKQISLLEDERERALNLLRDPKLLERILVDYQTCGVVGESTNKLIGYLAAISRKLDEPLAIIIQSTSAAGKSSLMEAILAFVPEEERIKYSAMTGQSLYYLGDTDLKHKVLAIVEEEGAERASYALKLLQSEGELTIASTGKDPNSGRMITQEYRVEGPVMIMLTTTAIDIDEELMNRCIILSVDESREQTRAIHELQREKRTLEGVRRKLDKAHILTTHQNAQRLLRPLKVVNPFARQLTFLDDRTRTRRDHEKYLTLIDTIAFLYQYQRPIKRDGKGLEYIEVQKEDIAIANRISGEALGRSLDELPPQTRRLLKHIEERVGHECERLAIKRSDFRFTRRDIRSWTNWSDSALKIHLHRLEEMEYLLLHRNNRGQSYVYELLYSGEGSDGRSFLMGLIDPEKLKYDANPSGQNGDRLGQNSESSSPSQPQVRGELAPSQPYQNSSEPFTYQLLEPDHTNQSEKSTLTEAL
jgi:DNA primase